MVVPIDKMLSVVITVLRKPIGVEVTFSFDVSFGAVSEGTYGTVVCCGYVALVDVSEVV